MTTKKQPTTDDRFTHPDSESEILRDPEASVYDKILSIIGEDNDEDSDSDDGDEAKQD